MAANFEKYANALAQAAAAGQKNNLSASMPAFKKTAAPSVLQYLQDPTVRRYLLGGLGGAGVGALIGAMQPGGKKRKSLSYGLMGGLGGLSLAHLLAANIGGNTANPPNSKPDSIAEKLRPAAETAAQIPNAALTPLRDLPAPAPVDTGNSYANAAINLPAQAVQAAVKTDPAFGAASPAAAIALGGGGALAGNRVARNLQTGLAAAIDRGNTARLSAFDAKNPALKLPSTLTTPNIGATAQDAYKKRVRADAIKSRQLNRGFVERGNNMRSRAGGLFGVLGRVALPAVSAYGAARAPGAVEQYNSTP